MDASLFKKMKVKPGFTAHVLYPPQGYPAGGDIRWGGDEPADFVHLFVTSRAEFDARLPSALTLRKPGALFWVSYPKSGGKQRYDINRDSLWDLSIPQGIHPVAQVALDEHWSAVRFVDNVPGEDYRRREK